MTLVFCDWCKARDEINEIMKQYKLSDRGLDNALEYFCVDNCEDKKIERNEIIEKIDKIKKRPMCADSMDTINKLNIRLNTL